jgi:hypothetical protein
MQALCASRLPGQGGCFDFRPCGHCVTSSGSNQTEIVQDPETPCGGHRILPLRVNEAGMTIDRSIGSSWTMRGQSLRQAAKASELLLRLLQICAS